jgi:nucleotide-binding universal stress UspA family protein
MSTPDNAPILLCYDRSADSRRAIETAGALFPGHKAIVLHVWSPVALMASAYGGMVALPVYDDHELQRAAQQITEDGVRVATEAGLDAQPEIAECTFNGTWHAILEVADEYDVRLIVLGARGLSTFKSLVLGSVSHGVAQHAHRPVLIVPPAILGEQHAGAPERRATAIS